MPKHWPQALARNLRQVVVRPPVNVTLLFMSQPRGAPPSFNLEPPATARVDTCRTFMRSRGRLLEDWIGIGQYLTARCRRWLQVKRSNCKARVTHCPITEKPALSNHQPLTTSH